MISTFALAISGFSPIHFAVGLVLLICVLAIVIIGIKYLMSLAKIDIPGPLLLIGGILLFMVLLMALLDYSGLYSF